MRRAIIYLLIFILLLAIPFGARLARFQRLGKPDRPEIPVYDPSGVPALVPTPRAATFVDEPEVGQGLVLLDQAHANSFSLDEISYLDSRLAARGFELVEYAGGDLANALRPVNGFIVIAPLTSFSSEEIQAVSSFVDQGGRLLLVGDPTRLGVSFEEDLTSFSTIIETDQIPLNSLANEFGLIFGGDYLYNTVENEGNFRNIILESTGLAEADVTDGLEQLAFYGSHSIQVGTVGRPLLTADENTWSSATDRPGGLALAALSSDDHVLAIGDIDFLSEPYYTVFDNSQFIAQMADFLTGFGRGYVLADFPYFFQPQIDLVYLGEPDLGSDAFDEIIAFQNTLAQADRRLALAAEPAAGRDVLYLGLYNQADEVSEMLSTADINLVIEPPIAADASSEETGSEAESDSGNETEDAVRRIESNLGHVQMSGTALIYLQQEAGQRRMILLAASSEGLENTIARLISLVPLDSEAALSDCLLGDDLALCPTGVADEEVEAVLVTGGAPDTTGTGGDETEDGEVVTGEPELQGAVGLGETVAGTLEAGQAHSWTFASEPITIDIFLVGEGDMDAVLELYDPDGNLVESIDDSLAGDEEQLLGVDITMEGDYLIVVKDFFEEGGSYVLTVDVASGDTGTDDFEPADQGELAIGDSVSGTLNEGETHAWRFTIDGPTAVNIILQSSENMDGVLALLGPEQEFIAIVDDTLVGGEERLDAVSLEVPGEYTIIVGDYFEGSGEYTLTLEQAEGAFAGDQDGGTARTDREFGYLFAHRPQLQSQLAI